MRINERQFGDVVVLDLHGPIAGAKAVAMVESTVRRLSREGIRHVVACLADVPHVDLGGLGALVDAHRYVRQANGTFKLARVTKRIHDLIVITRLLTVFDTYDSVEEAVGGPVPAYAGVEAPQPSPLSLGMVQRSLRRA
jgi:anti-sigma B factor antagonist